MLRFNFISKACYTLGHNREVNLGSWSETIDMGTLVFARLLETEGLVVYSDASKKVLGCVLMQHGKVIAYASR
jgi:hypothetical protein